MLDSVAKQVSGAETGSERVKKSAERERSDERASKNQRSRCGARSGRSLSEPERTGSGVKSKLAAHEPLNLIIILTVTLASRRHIPESKSTMV